MQYHAIPWCMGAKTTPRIYSYVTLQQVERHDMVFVKMLLINHGPENPNSITCPPLHNHPGQELCYELM